MNEDVQSAKVDPQEVDRILNRLRRVEGLARGLQRMIEEGRDCEDILTQLAATRAALDRVGIYLITTKVRECLLDEEDTSSEAAIERALETFLKYAQTLHSSPAGDGS
jgi:DNA-binding FrmR family transcriptional regulator